MRITKLLIGLAGIAGMAASAMASEPGVVVVDLQGNRIEMAYTQLNRININNDGVQLISSPAVESPSTVAYSDLDRILIGADVSSVESVIADATFAVWPTVTDGVVNVKSANSQQVNVTSMSGAIVATAAISAGEVSAIDLSAAPAGVYIVSCADTSVKVIKK
ncbi:MAG: T9SS type A sorting domain-containing protein [Muribaculaceae bacterium]|nr:T9SS type A sorting domain-containing protein [Muribaculaceae bacterium]